MKKILITFFIIILSAYFLNSNETFFASKSLTENAQEIRLRAKKMGFIVNNPTSLTAAAIIQAKVELYPKGVVEVSLRITENGKLDIKAQAKSEDAGKAEWHRIPAKKK
jgi:hypothetical protein